MKHLLNQTISCAYKNGRETLLTPTWGGRNLLIPDSRMYYIVEGEIEVDFEDEKIIAEAGDLLLIPAKQKHSCFMTQKKFARKYWCHFELKKEGRDFFDNYRLPHKIRVGMDPSLIAIFRELFESNEKPSPLRELLTSAAIGKLVSYYMERCEIVERTQDPDEIDRAIRFIKNNYHEAIPLERLAADANFTPNYFIKKFKERTGMTPIKYLNALRIEIAKDRLLHSGDSVNAVLEQVGFLDSAYFSKLFKKTTGYSPKAFREMYVGHNERLFR